MNIFQAILLGIVQGITEFLPISSSAHLVVVPYLLGWKIPQEQIFPFDILVQMGTVFSLIIYFRKDLQHLLQAFFKGIKTRHPFKEDQSRLGWLLLLATIPAGFAGLFLKDLVEKAFSSSAMTAFFLFGTAFLLVIAEVVGKRTHELSQLKWQNALLVGVFQALSIFPGISRSGACISGGLIQNFNRKDASRFAFLMAIPVMLAAGLLGVIDLLQIQNIGQFLPILMAGFFISAFVGYFVIGWLLQYVNRHSLFPFAIYCVVIGVIVLGFNFLSPQNSSNISSLSEVDGTIYIDSHLDWIIADAIACNASSTGSLLNIADQANLPEEGSENYQITYFLQPSENEFAYLLGYETLSLVVSPENPLTQLSHLQLQDIYNNIFESWADFLQDCPQCGSLSELSDLGTQEIQTWIYPGESPFQSVIKDFLPGHPTFITSLLAPSPQAMREALHINPAAIGFLPSHWIDDSLKTIEITDSNLQDLQLPILATSPTEPDQILKSFLLCLQSSLDND